MEDISLNSLYLYIDQLNQRSHHGVALIWGKKCIQNISMKTSGKIEEELGW
jgi:hypothetical protein